MSWFYKKVTPDVDVKKIESLASELDNAKMEPAKWFGRRVVVGKEDFSPRVKAILQDIKTNLSSLEGEARARTITLLTKLDSLYNVAGKVGWFNPTGKAAQSLKLELEKQDLLDQCTQKCLDVSNKQTGKAVPSGLIELLKKMPASKESELLGLKKQAIQLVYGSIQEPLLNDQKFVEKLWTKIKDTLCIQRHSFFDDLSLGPKKIVSAKNDEAKNLYQKIAGRSRNREPNKVKLDEDIEVQVPGDFKDSIERTVFKQIENMKGTHPSVKGNSSREDLSKVFLSDLRAKLGPKRECLLEPLLVSIEQACDNYGFEEIAKEMNTQFSGGIYYHVLEDTIRHVVRIKIPKDENQPVEACVMSDYPMRMMDLGDQSGILRKFTPAEIQSTLTLKFKVPEGPVANASDYCQEVSFAVGQVKTPIDESQYLIEEAE